MWLTSKVCFNNVLLFPNFLYHTLLLELILFTVNCSYNNGEEHFFRGRKGAAPVTVLLWFKAVYTDSFYTFIF